jgi:hypothetical protein
MEQRLIDANALKESFRKQTVNVQGKIKDDADAIIEAICKDVDLTPTVDAVPVEWISVEDRLPGAYENVLVCENDDVLLAYWNGHEWVQCDLYEYVTLYPTYWMELPKPPSAKMKGEQNDHQRM